MIRDEGTRFLNVDLDIIARVPLDAVVEAFGEKAFVLYVGRRGRLYSAHVEMSDSYRDNADQLIKKILALVKRLPRDTRRIWDQAISREFNIGIEAAHKSPVYVLRLKQDTLRDVISVNGTIVVTVYPPEIINRLQQTTRQKDKRMSRSGNDKGPRGRSK